MNQTPDVVVIGAGWAGLTAASRLTAQGRSVVVVDKARGPGGRSSTRREAGFAFDHGAQHFTACSEAFRRQVRAWESVGLVAEWQPRLQVFGQRPEEVGTPPARRLVAVPGMNSVLKRLAAGLECHFASQVTGIEHDGQWRVSLADGSTIGAAALVLTAPPPQAAALLGSGHPLHDRLQAVNMQPCWALMLGFDEPVAVDLDAAFINHGPLAWLARNRGKPRRTGGESWVVHADAGWSRQHLEARPEAIARDMISALRELVPAFRREPVIQRAHRWRYALADPPLQSGCLKDGETRLVVAGDWCSGSRIEGAWASGVAAARMLETLAV